MVKSPQMEKTPHSDQVVLHMDQPTQPPLEAQQNSTSSPLPSLSSPLRTTITTTIATTRALHRLKFSKPKSRFVEFNHTYHRPILDQDLSNFAEDGDHKEEDDEEDEEEMFKEENLHEKYRKKKHKVGWQTIAEWLAFVVIMSCLIGSLTVPAWRKVHFRGLVLWKWYLMVLVVLCGRLVSGWLVGLIAFVIERHFMLREKVLYFVYGLRKSVRNCVWLGLVLIAWYVMFNPELQDETRNHKFLDRVWRALIAITIGAVIWLIKIVLVKVLASSFHVATFFDRMKESVFHYYILEKLSGPPLDESVRLAQSSRAAGGALARPKTMLVRVSKRDHGSSRRIDMEKLRRLSREKASVFSVRRLVSHIKSSGLSTISRTVDKTMEEFNETESEITSEWEISMCAHRIFSNVAKHGQKYIEEGDLLRFLEKDEVHTIFPLFEGAMETGKIKKSAFRNWMVRAYLERKALAHSLNDTKTAVQQLHKLASAIVTVIIIVVSLLVMGVASTKVVMLLISQLVLLGFMFGNTCKTIFESIIFVFVIHPFDVGDRCIIDSVQMVVEEMNILTTVFLRYDNEKIYYPNAVLITKPISNFYRSPEMGDSIHFDIDVSTSIDSFNDMKEAIKKYVESKPKHWRSKHQVVVKEIENLNKMKVALYLTHTMNFQNMGEKNSRRSEFMLELKKIFESLNIKYHLLPQNVRLTQVPISSARIPLPRLVDN